MNITVTGASGFVGGHVVSQLTAAGHHVVSAVRRPGSAPHGSDEAVVGDLDESTDWDAALTGADAVVHLAARVHVMSEKATGSLVEFRRVNASATHRLAVEAARHDCRRFVFLSTIKVNGESTRGTPLTVHDDPHPSDAYAQSKWEAEQHLRAVAATSVLEPVIIRPPLIYGPGVGGNIERSLRWLQRGVPLPLASVRNSRSLLSVSALALLIERALVDPHAAGALIVAADPHAISTSELFMALGQGLDRPARLLPFPPALLRFLAGMVGQRAVVERLLDSLVVQAGSSKPEFDCDILSSPERELRSTAQWFANELSSARLPEGIHS